MRARRCPTAPQPRADPGRDDQLLPVRPRQASAPGAAAGCTQRVLEAMGGLATPTMAVLRARRVASRLLGRGQTVAPSVRRLTSKLKYWTFPLLARGPSAIIVERETGSRREPRKARAGSISRFRLASDPTGCPTAPGSRLPPHRLLMTASGITNRADSLPGGPGGPRAAPTAGVWRTSFADSPSAVSRPTSRSWRRARVCRDRCCWACLCSPPSPPTASSLAVTDVAERLALSPSTTHRYMSTLLAVGLLEQDPRSRRYHVPLPVSPRRCCPHRWANVDQRRLTSPPASPIRAPSSRCVAASPAHSP